MLKNLGLQDLNCFHNLKAKINYITFLKNKEVILGKKFYYCVGFDIIDYVILTPFKFFEYESSINVACSVIEIMDGCENKYYNNVIYKLHKISKDLDEGVIKPITPEKHAKLLLEYGN